MRARDIIETVRRPGPVLQPWTLTLQEYYAAANKKNKSHDMSAYRTTVEKLNTYIRRSEFPHVLKRENGIDYCSHKEPLSYGEWEDPERMTGYRSVPPEEVKKQGLPDVAVSLAAFDGETCVGTAADEWGAVLYRVAEEYQGEGIGTNLGYLYRKIYPGKDSGGFTPAGAENFRRIHRRFVEDAWRAGKYKKAIAAGQMTQDRVDEIVNSTAPGESWLIAQQREKWDDEDPDLENKLSTFRSQHERKNGERFKQQLSQPPKPRDFSKTPRAQQERFAREIYRRAMASPYLQDKTDPEEVRQIILSDDKLGEWLWSKENASRTSENEVYDVYIPMIKRWVEQSAPAHAVVEALLNRETFAI